MTKRSGDHNLQKERRKKALAERQADPNHEPSQTYVGGWPDQWKKARGRASDTTEGA